MNMFFLLFAMLVASCAASCPNECNFNGKCNKDSACVCYRNYVGADCSERMCYHSHAFMDFPQGDLNADGRVNRPDVSIITVVAGIVNSANVYSELDFVKGTAYGDFPANRYVRTSPCTSTKCTGLPSAVCTANPLCVWDLASSGLCGLNPLDASGVISMVAAPSASDMETSGVVIQSSKAFGLVTGTDSSGNDIKKVAYRLAVVTHDGNPPSLEAPSATNIFPMPDASCLMSAEIAALTSTSATYALVNQVGTGSATCTDPDGGTTCNTYIANSATCLAQDDAASTDCVFTAAPMYTFRVKTPTSAAAEEAMYLYDTQFTNAKTWEQYPKNHGWANRKSASPKLKSSYDEAHFYRECSGKGLCDRGTGECECFDGYEGAGCTRTTCPNGCSGHGVCVRLGDLPKPSAQWDRHKTQQCVCDAGYTNTDCSGRKCAKGDDPITRPVGAQDYTFVSAADVTTKYPSITGTHKTQRSEVQHFGYTAEITDNSHFALEFTDETGKTWMTKTMNMRTVSASDVEAALESLPGNVIEDVDVEARYFDAGLLAVAAAGASGLVTCTPISAGGDGSHCGGYRSIISSSSATVTPTGDCTAWTATTSATMEFAVTAGTFDTSLLAVGNLVYDGFATLTAASAGDQVTAEKATTATTGGNAGIIKAFTSSSLTLECTSATAITATYLATALGSRCLLLDIWKDVSSTTSRGRCVNQTPLPSTCNAYKLSSPCPATGTLDGCCGQPRMFAVTFLSNSGDVAPLGIRYSVQQSAKMGGSCRPNPNYPPTTGYTCHDAFATCSQTTYTSTSGDAAKLHFCEWDYQGTETDDNGSFRPLTIVQMPSQGGCDDEACTNNYFRNVIARAELGAIFSCTDPDGGTTCNSYNDPTCKDYNDDSGDACVWGLATLIAATDAIYNTEINKPGAVQLDAARSASLEASRLTLKSASRDPLSSVADSVSNAMRTAFPFLLHTSYTGTQKGTEIQKVGYRAGVEPLANLIGKKKVYDKFLESASGYANAILGSTTDSTDFPLEAAYFALKVGGGRMPLVIGTEGVKGTQEDAVCSNRGLCDYDSGLCKCFNGFTEDDCSVQNALAMY